jgi:hypothetical protein
MQKIAYHIHGETQFMAREQVSANDVFSPQGVNGLTFN